jgi:hypothetical protein
VKMWTMVISVVTSQSLVAGYQHCSSTFNIILFIYLRDYYRPVNVLLDNKLKENNMRWDNQF